MNEKDATIEWHEYVLKYADLCHGFWVYWEYVLSGISIFFFFDKDQNIPQLNWYFRSSYRETSLSLAEGSKAHNLLIYYEKILFVIKNIQLF